MANKISKIIGRINSLPSPLRTRALSLAVGNIVPYVGTSGLCVDELTEERAVVSVKNRRKVQNHIKTVHASASVLIAETATGFICAMNCPDEKMLLMKSLSARFLKRSKGRMKAVATLTPEQKEHMLTAEKGDVNVKVVLTDASGAEPVVSEMVWAWVPKKK